MNKQYLLYIMILIWINTGFSQTWKTYPYTPAGSLISFPPQTKEGTPANLLNGGIPPDI